MLVIRAFWSLCACLPPHLAGGLGATLMGVLGPRLSKNRKIERNLKVAFPAKSEFEIRSLRNDVWRNFGRTLSEYPLIARIYADRRLIERFDFDVTEETLEIVAESRPVIFVGAHISNWEFSALALRLLGVPLSVVYTPLRNDLIDDAVRKEREAMECGCIPKSNGILPLVKCLSRGTSVGLLVDRKLKNGPRSEFFGRKTCFSHAPARLAIKFGRPIVPIFIERGGAGRFIARLDDPIWPAPQHDDKRAHAAMLTTQLMSIIEREIRRRPGDWFCSQSIWPKHAGIIVEGAV